MFGWDFEVDAWSNFIFRISTKICFWTCDKNSTLGSVVPLAMFICVLDTQLVNCQCCYWTAFIFMKSCLYFLSLATLVLNLKEWQRRVVLIKGCDALGEVICQNISFFVPRSCQPASQISMEDLDEGMRRKFELFTNCSFQSLPIAPWYSTHMVSLKMQPKLLC